MPEKIYIFAKPPPPLRRYLWKALRMFYLTSLCHSHQNLLNQPSFKGSTINDWGGAEEKSKRNFFLSDCLCENFFPRIRDTKKKNPGEEVSKIFFLVINFFFNLKKAFLEKKLISKGLLKLESCEIHVQFWWHCWNGMWMKNSPTIDKSYSIYK